MAAKPANEKLWNTIILIAKSKFRVWPSAAAAHWVHQSYVQKGGQFIDTSKDAKTGRPRR